jgi:hypothetical protein
MGMMETRVRMLDEKHPFMLTSMNNLAFTCEGQGRCKDTTGLMHEYVRLRTQVLGAGHHLSLFFNRGVGWLET